MSPVNIPGLIAKSSTTQEDNVDFNGFLSHWKSDDKMNTETQKLLENTFSEQKKKQYEEEWNKVLGVNSSINHYKDDNLYYQEQLNQGLIPDYAKKTRRGFPPSVTRTSTIDMEELMQKYLNPPKSDFEHIIDALFTVEEKLDYLKGLGYSIFGNPPSPNLNNFLQLEKDGNSCPGNLGIIFLREISIKFKNLLLAKPILKVKL